MRLADLPAHILYAPTRVCAECSPNLTPLPGSYRAAVAICCFLGCDASTEKHFTEEDAALCLYRPLAVVSCSPPAPSVAPVFPLLFGFFSQTHQPLSHLFSVCTGDWGRGPKVRVSLPYFLPSALLQKSFLESCSCYGDRPWERDQ